MRPTSFRIAPVRSSNPCSDRGLRVAGLSLPNPAHRPSREVANPDAVAIDQSAQNAQALDLGQHPRRARDPAFCAGDLSANANFEGRITGWEGMMWAVWPAFLSGGEDAGRAE